MRFQIHECRVYVWTSKHLTPELPRWICDSVTKCALVGGIADIATRAMETGTHDDSWENFQNKLVLVSRDRNCVKQKGLGWTSGECVLIMAKWGGHNLRRCYNHVKARQANQMLQKRLHHMSTICLFSLDMSPGQRCLSPCLRGTKDSCLAAKNSFRSATTGRKSSRRSFLGRLPQKQHTKRPSTPSGHWRTRRGHLELPCACGFIVFMWKTFTYVNWTYW